jgi:hypothetical protein
MNQFKQFRIDGIGRDFQQFFAADGMQRQSRIGRLERIPRID